MVHLQATKVGSLPTMQVDMLLLPLPTWVGPLLTMQVDTLLTMLVDTLLTMQGDMLLTMLQVVTLPPTWVESLLLTWAGPLLLTWAVPLLTVAMAPWVACLRITMLATRDQTRIWEGFPQMQDGQTMLPIETHQAGIWEEQLVETHILGEI